MLQRKITMKTFSEKFATSHRGQRENWLKINNRKSFDRIWKF